MNNDLCVELIGGENHIVDHSAPHSYAVETKVDGEVLKIYVAARSRTQAGSRVRKLGYEVRSVNMEG